MNTEWIPVTRAARRVLCIFLVVFSLPALAQGLEVTASEGEAKIRFDGLWQTPRVGMAVSLPAVVSTGTAGSVRLEQGETRISVAPNSTIELLADSASGELVERVVQDSGSTFYDVAPQGSKRFRVESPYLVAVVKGTEFNVTVTPDSSTVSLYEGHLQVDAPDVGDSVDIFSGEIARRHRDDPRIVVISMADGEIAARVDAPGSGNDPGHGGGTTDDGNMAGSDDAGGIPVSNFPGLSGGAAVGDRRGDNGSGVTAQVGIGDVSADVRGSASLDAIDGDVAAEVSAGIDGGSVTAKISAGVDTGDISADAGVDAGVDLGAGTVDAGVETALDVGGVTADAAVDAGVDLDAGTIDTGVDTALDVGGVAADADLDTGVDLDAGTVEVDTGLDTAVVTADVGASVDTGDGLGVDADVADAGVTAVDADVDLGGGSVSVDTGVGDTDIGVDLDLGSLLGDDTDNGADTADAGDVIDTGDEPGADTTEPDPGDDGLPGLDGLLGL